jgi:hypothetical protein
LSKKRSGIETFFSTTTYAENPYSGTLLRNPVMATTQSAGSRPVIPNDGDRRFRTMATTRRSGATLVY